MNSLEVALQANAAAYRRAVQASAPGDCWDFVVLTAANEKQAQGYRQELALAERAVGPTGAFFPAIQRTLVVPDPPGRRAGSGGATLAVLRALSEQFGLGVAELRKLRILLIHSGGASQRLPAYSPLGKIFAPLPLLRPDGHIATLFDHLYLTLAGLPERLGPGMLILAGDVFLLFDHRHVATPPAGVTAISMRVEAPMGRGHGVFVIDSKNRITQTLQKVSVDAMAKAGATDANGQVLIDTGLLFFDAERTALLAELAGCASGGGGRRGARKGLHERHPIQIDLYEDMTGALAKGASREEFLRPPELRAMRRELWSLLRQVPFQATELEGQFLHLGTTRQFRDAMVGRNPSPAAELFQRNVLAHSDWEIGDERRVYHSVLRSGMNGGGTLGRGSVVEHSILCAGCSVGEGSVVSQVVAESKPISVPDNLLLFQVPVRGEDGKLAYVQVACGVDDDMKGRCDQGRCVYLNRPIDDWLTRCGVDADEVWPGIPAERRTLWAARMFVATRQRDAAAAGLALAGKKVTRAAVAAWRKSPRYSMAMILEQADPAGLIAHREVVSAALQTAELIDSVHRGEDRPLEAVIGRYTTPAAYAESQRLLEGAATRPAGDDPAGALGQARLLWHAAQLLQRPDHPHPSTARPQIEPFMRRAFAKVAEASEIGHRRIEADSRVRAKLRPGTQVTATAPVRIDLAGGWSDTPPYCFERGGHVVNVALNLDGRPPVRAVVRTIAEPQLILESHDLGKRLVVSRASSRPADLDVTDPFALHKVALALAGLLPSDHDDVRRHLRGLGAGLHVITESRVPKGSGLGTSSILAATLLAALHKLCGRRNAPESLIEQTLLLEQRLSTGGGWQDQVPGIVGGIVSTITDAGVPQKPIIERLELSDAQHRALEERLVVYFSGQQRLARDILRRVMGRWLGREPAMQLLTESLKTSAAALREALLKSRWTAAAEQMGRYWQLKKELYPGSTTPAIDLLFLETRDEYLAAGLAGAGGGGFAYFFCRDAAQAARLRTRLADFSARPGSLGGVYNAEINRTGLVVKSAKVR
jgi:fucokinase